MSDPPVPPKSVREQVLAAVKTQLDTVSAPNVTGTITVYRARRNEVPEGKLPALNFFVAGATPLEQLSAGVTRNFLRITIEGQVKGTSDANLDSQLADLAAAVQKAMETDHTLGGIAVDCVATADDQAAADVDGVGAIGAVLASYDIEFWTKPGDPYALAP